MSNSPVKRQKIPLFDESDSALLTRQSTQNIRMSRDFCDSSMGKKELPDFIQENSPVLENTEEKKNFQRILSQNNFSAVRGYINLIQNNVSYDQSSHMKSTISQRNLDSEIDPLQESTQFDGAKKSRFWNQGAQRTQKLAKLNEFNSQYSLKASPKREVFFEGSQSQTKFELRKNSPLNSTKAIQIDNSFSLSPVKIQRVKPFALVGGFDCDNQQQKIIEKSETFSKHSLVLNKKRSSIGSLIQSKISIKN